MDGILPWLGDLHRVDGLAQEWRGLICVFLSVVCGAFVGYERERRDKPAGLRTVVLITVGSTIFTMMSFLVAENKPTADPARIAAQIVPGIGFLGAGAIIYARGTVLGLTTGATIWSCAAVGVTIGSGYVAAGFVFTTVIFLTLTLLHRVEHLVGGRCRFVAHRIWFRSERGKTWVQIRHVLDRFWIPDGRVAYSPTADVEQCVDVTVCVHHRGHRVVLKEFVDIPEVVGIEERSRERCTVAI